MGGLASDQLGTPPDGSGGQAVEALRGAGAVTSPVEPPRGNGEGGGGGMGMGKGRKREGDEEVCRVGGGLSGGGEGRPMESALIVTLGRY